MSDEPESIKGLREKLRLWDEHGQCPNVQEANHACVWTCTECKASMPPTMSSGPGAPVRHPARCAKRGGGR